MIEARIIAKCTNFYVSLVYGFTKELRGKFIFEVVFHEVSLGYIFYYFNQFKSNKTKVAIKRVENYIVSLLSNISYPKY